MVPRDSRDRVWNRICNVGGLVERLTIKSSPVLANGSVSFRKVTALAGVHGAGKSYLLAAVAEGLPRWQVGNNLPIENSRSEAVFRGDYQLSLRRASPADTVSFSRPVSWEERRDFDESLAPLRVTFLTPYVALSELAYFTDNYKPYGPPAPIEVRPLKRAHVDGLRAVTGHAYESISYGLINDPDGYFPFLQAERDSRVVDASTMSSSEFWVHFVIWHVYWAGTNEVVLIDEPETFLAQPGHRAFVDAITRMALESECQVIFATHSETMIRSLPPELVRHVSNSTEGAVVAEVTSTERLLRTLGRSREPLSVLVFVEDKMARAIVQFLVRRYAADRAAQVDVIDSGGKDEATRGAAIAGRSAKLRSVAVLDGDQSDRCHDQGNLFIPGVADPESLLLNVIRMRVRDVANRIDVTVSDLQAALDSARFVPHQRTFEVISDALDISPAELVPVLLSMWLEDDSIAMAAASLVDRILSPGAREL